MKNISNSISGNFHTNLPSCGNSSMGLKVVESRDLEKEILDKTHYGLTIFAFVLKKCFPEMETVVKLEGRICKPTKNPFNKNKYTLEIEVVDGIAMFSDSDAQMSGSVFDFASRFFGKERQELLEKLDKEMDLGLCSISADSELEHLIQNSNIADSLKEKSPMFSYFLAPISNVHPVRTIGLVETYDLIRDKELAFPTNKLRSYADVKEAKKYKAYNFNYVTFSGVFSSRNDRNLKKHSGLLTIDFDDLEDIGDLKSRLMQDKYFETELMFVSPSGNGLKWIIPIDLTAATHQDYFKGVSNYIHHSYKVEVDQSGKDVSRACFLPHDPNVYINPKYL